MATIAELAQMSNNAYDGSPYPTQNTGPGGPLLAGLSSDWEVIANSNLDNAQFWVRDTSELPITIR